jgi:hypothetical protein
MFAGAAMAQCHECTTKLLQKISADKQCVMFRAPPEDRTDGATSFSRLVRVGKIGISSQFCTTRTHLAVIVKAGFSQYRNYIAPAKWLSPIVIIS